MNVLHVRFDDPQAPELFARSLRQTGFAVITNHPISRELIAGAYNEWERFFADEEKHAHRFDPVKQAGYFPFRTEKAKGYKVSDLKEFYHYYPERIRLPQAAWTFTPALYSQLSTLGAELLGWLEDYTPEHIRCQFAMPL